MSQKLCQQCQQPIPIASQFCAFCGYQQVSQSLTGQLPPDAQLDGRYVIDTLLGQGGMGAVYKVVDTRISGRVCAIKEMSVLSLPAHEQAQAVQGFRQEAQFLAKLKHPNLPQVHDYFSESSTGRHYLVMDYVAGATLEEKLQQNGRPFSEDQVRTWAIQLCDVLTYLHRQTPPVIFRDLKPDNIMVDKQGQLKLIDFGIARFFKPAQSKDTQAIGTPGYASPEQHGKGQTDARSDVYGLGVTLWRLLTMHDPANNPFHLPSVRSYNSAVSTDLEVVIQRTMQLRPEDRFQTTQELRTALQDHQSPPPSPPRPNYLLWVGLVGIFMALFAGGLYVFSNRVTPTPIPTSPPQTIIVVTEIMLTAVPTEDADAVEPSPVPPTFTAIPVVDNPEVILPSTPLPPTTTPIPSPTPTAELSASTVGSDGVDMILIPAGEFIMGSTSEDVDTAVSICRQSGNTCPRSYFTNEMPQRIVYLSNFYIDATEITNDQYRACVDADACPAPSDSGAPDARFQVNNYYNSSRYRDYPVVRIRWEDARTYCQWVGERLPTEAEWEKAARGTDGRLFPWGNGFDNGKANTQDGGSDTLKSVGSYPDGRSPYGVYDMAGNVWEYVADWYSDTYYHDAQNDDPLGPSSGADHVLRGGSYSDFKEYARVTNRGTPHSGSIRSGFRGFRCVRPVE